MMDSDTNNEDLVNLARTIIDSNMYMVLGTADAAGNPWVSPVYYASASYKEFYWVSSPDVRHSQNIAVHPQVSIVIFDSQAPIGKGQGMYLYAIDQMITCAEINLVISIIS